MDIEGITPQEYTPLTPCGGDLGVFYLTNGPRESSDDVHPARHTEYQSVLRLRERSQEEDEGLEQETRLRNALKQ